MWQHCPPYVFRLGLFVSKGFENHIVGCLFQKCQEVFYFESVLFRKYQKVFYFESALFRKYQDVFYFDFENAKIGIKVGEMIPGLLWCFQDQQQHATLSFCCRLRMLNQCQ